VISAAAAVPVGPLLALRRLATGRIYPSVTRLNQKPLQPNTERRPRPQHGRPLDEKSGSSVQAVVRRSRWWSRATVGPRKNVRSLEDLSQRIDHA